MTDTAAPALDPAAPPVDPTTRLARFRARREETVVQPMGSLALVNTQWVDSAQPVWGVPGEWAPRDDGGSGLIVTAEATDGIRVDGETVNGSAVVRGKDDAEPSVVRFSDTVQGTVIAQVTSNGGPSNGAAAATGYALRIWDAASDGIRDFGSIDAYPYNPDWVVTPTFTPNPEGTVHGFAHLKDGDETREEAIPGSITFEKDGESYDLLAFRSGRALQLVFSDATSGTDTYSVGRFLFVAPRPDGSIVLDFNLAVLPPCAFSYAFNCPIPPKQNRFSVPIEAGEKNVLAKDGTILHG